MTLRPARQHCGHALPTTFAPPLCPRCPLPWFCVPGRPAHLLVGVERDALDVLRVIMQHGHTLGIPVVLHCAAFKRCRYSRLANDAGCTPHTPSHIQMLLSRLHEASNSPDAAHVTLLTSFSWPSSVAAISHSAAGLSHRHTVASNEHDARYCPEGDHATPRIVRVCPPSSTASFKYCVVMNHVWLWEDLD